VLVAAPALATRVGYDGRSPQDVVWPAVVRQGWGDDGGWDLAGSGGAVRVPAKARLDLFSPLAMRACVTGLRTKTACKAAEFVGIAGPGQTRPPRPRMIGN
jgi:hypothetical protein